MSKKYFVDTSSFIELLEDYPHSAANKKLYKKIKAAFMNGTCILLESVRAGLKNKKIGELLVPERLDFLKPEEGGVKAQKNMAWIPEEIHKKINPGWVAERTQKKLAKGDLNIAIFNKEKNRMMENANFQLIFAAMEYSGILNAPEDGKLSPNLKNNDGIIVTEKTKKENDGKTFKNIPQIADIEGIECINLPEMLKRIGVEIQYTTK